MPSIIQDWVANLHLRQQGVLVSAVRGCDSAPKDDPCKPVSRCLRAEILVPATPKPTFYIQHVDDDELARRMEAFLNNCDHYPVHFIMHLLHAASIVGYYSPTRQEPWRKFYHAACKKLHVRPESKEDVEARLCAPEDVFRAQQHVRLHDGGDPPDTTEVPWVCRQDCCTKCGAANHALRNRCRECGAALYEDTEAPARVRPLRRDWHSIDITRFAGGFTCRANERTPTADGAPAGLFLSLEIVSYHHSLPAALRAFADEIEHLNTQDHVSEATDTSP